MLKRAEIAAGILSVCISLALAGCTVYGGKKNAGWHSSGGEAHERQFWADRKARNVSELEKHIALTWVWVSPSGTMDRDATLRAISEAKIEDYTLSDFKVTPNGSDMVVTYTAQVRGSYNGQPLPAGPRKMMTVWQKAQRGWIAIAHAEMN